MPVDASRAPTRVSAFGGIFSNEAANGAAVWRDDTDPEIATCGSPWERTSHAGKCFFIGGFHYDHYIDGRDDFPCDGCIDTKFVIP